MYHSDNSNGVNFISKSKSADEGSDSQNSEWFKLILPSLVIHSLELFSQKTNADRHVVKLL